MIEIKIQLYEYYASICQKKNTGKLTTKATELVLNKTKGGVCSDESKTKGYIVPADTGVFICDCIGALYTSIRG